MKDVDKLEGVQRRATKMVRGLETKSYEERWKELVTPTKGPGLPIKSLHEKSYQNQRIHPELTALWINNCIEMVLLTLFLFSVPVLGVSPGAPLQCQASYDRVDNCTNPLKTCESDSCGTILLNTSLTFTGASGRSTIRYQYVENTCATESFCANAGKQNFRMKFQMAECQPATPGGPPSSAQLKGLSEDTLAEPRQLRLVTLLGRENSKSIILTEASIRCQESYDRVDNCTNPLLKTCENGSASCGTILLSTSLTFKGASGPPTRRYEFGVIACASESFCANAGNPNFRMTYRMAECQPGDTATSRTTTTSLTTTSSACGRVMLASARVYLQALGCFLVAKAFSLCFVSSR